MQRVNYRSPLCPCPERQDAFAANQLSSEQIETAMILHELRSSDRVTPPSTDGARLPTDPNESIIKETGHLISEQITRERRFEELLRSSNLFGPPKRVISPTPQNLVRNLLTDLPTSVAHLIKSDQIKPTNDTQNCTGTHSLLPKDSRFPIEVTDAANFPLLSYRDLYQDRSKNPDDSIMFDSMLVSKLKEQLSPLRNGGTTTFNCLSSNNLSFDSNVVSPFNESATCSLANSEENEEMLRLCTPFPCLKVSRRLGCWVLENHNPS